MKASDWIFLYTPMHTGTHFVRLLLELHPAVSFWKCGKAEVDGKNLREWHVLCQEERISFSDLVRLAIECPPHHPSWAQMKADRFGISIPAKTVRRTLVHAHITPQRFWYPELQTVVTVRDPILSVISCLRWGRGPLGVDDLVSAFEFLAGIEIDSCFWFCTDLWRNARDKALDLFPYLNLTTTPEIREFVARWPVLNSTSEGNFPRRDDPQLLEARRLAVNKQGVHPVIQPWVKKLRDTGIQAVLEKLGYRDLAWFE